MQHSSDLADALLLASRALVGVAARSLAGVDDVTLPQYRALVLVWSRERTTVSDLARALGVHTTTATRLCDRLVRKRMLRRSEASDDRRQTDLHVTKAGVHMLERVTERRRKDLAAIVGRMSVTDARKVIRVLDAFAAAASVEDFGVEADLFGWHAASSR